MKVTALSIARAFVDIARTLQASEISALSDAAAQVLSAHGLLQQSRTFPTLVERVWRQQEGTTAVRVTTRTGNAGPAIHDLLAIIQKSMGKTCVVEERADPRILGGAMLTIGDERFDATLRRALQDLSSRITQPIPTP